MLWETAAKQNMDWINNCKVTPFYGYPSRLSSQNQGSTEQPNTDVYVDTLLSSIEKVIDNEAIFPADEMVPFPENFDSIVRRLFKKLFMVVALLFSNKCLQSKLSNTNADTFLQHFIYLG